MPGRATVRDAVLPARNLLDPFGLAPRAARLGGRAGSAAERAALDTLKRALASRQAAEVLDVVLRSPLLPHAANELLDRGVVDQVLESPRLEPLLSRVLESAEVDRLLDRALDSARLTALVTHVLDSDGMQRLVAQVIESRVFDTGVARVLEADEVWHAIDEIASSPAVTQAITQQSVGFADQVAGELGERSRRVDARLERAARRLVRRRPPPGDAAGPPVVEPGTP
jgi:hypothetical protein